MKHTKSSWRLTLSALAILLLTTIPSFAQTTTGSITGTAADESGGVLPGATVTVVHDPSGTRYETVTRADGRFSFPAVRVGGPYTVTVALSGFQSSVSKNVEVSLGVSSDIVAKLKTAALSEEVTVTAEADPVFSSARTGAATAVSREKLAALPTLNDRIDSFVRLSPQASGRDLSFGGSDNRLNNITVDGSFFNNSFGLGAAPGDRTGVSPISVAAIEEMQVSVAPYDVRQGHFIGASVNAVTRSGTNDYRGSAYYWFRDQDQVGKKAGANTFNPGTFTFHKFGAWVSGPIIKNKAFFFGSFEDDTQTQPGTTFRANKGGEAVGGSVTRVLASDLDALKSFLSTNFKYDTGPYQDYDHLTPSRRYLGKIDYNLNDRNHVSLRYSQLDSNTDVLASNSASLGFGNRRSSTLGLNFQNTNYQIGENRRSVIGEWNSTFGTNAANTLIVGYDKSDESRQSRGSLFPMVDILEAGSVYTTFGFEAFTPNNELRYKTFQAQNNFTLFRGKHTLTFGGSLERYESENVFYPGSQGIYTYNSLADFYTDARDYIANPNRTTSPITLRRFQVRYLNIPGLDKPTQPLEVWYNSLYAQDDFQATDRLKFTAGIRVDRPSFGDTGYKNALADALTFRDETGSPVQYSTKKLPDPVLQFSPRLGFNWDVTGDRTTQARGGTGLFAGPPLYVWISNQIGNTGVLTGFDDLSNTTARPFNPNPNAYKPTNVTGAPAASYELALTDKNFRFPRVWRTNLAVDRKLPWNLVGTGEFIYEKSVDGISYINANLAPANSAFTGADTRPRWTTTACNIAQPTSATNCINRIYPQVANATVLKNQDRGKIWHASGALEKNFKGGFLKAAYSYGVAKNTVDAGSIAFGSWSANQISGDPNNPALGYGTNSPGKRFFLAGSFSREYLKIGATSVSLFWQMTQGNGTYTVSGDLNNDGTAGNDLIYVPRNQSEMNFVAFTAAGRTFTPAEQAAAWDAYISQDKYLSSRRGQYAERNGVFLPMIKRADMSITQELFRGQGGRRHALQFRADIQNIGNLINKNWGVGRRFVSAQPLILATAAQGGPLTATGAPQYTMRAINGQLVSTSFEPSVLIGDVYQIQFSLKYTFH